ncbi:hypothetical protein L484_007431 [Morus notabilis]|uniref:Uncharacterized protein n=1 Tax=Morus notabilis TaxID=981085 RepID=W9QZC9_9ROSA|nr:hypothetical protein L484_007431 [Morus notabilis]
MLQSRDNWISLGVGISIRDAVGGLLKAASLGLWGTAFSSCGESKHWILESYAFNVRFSAWKLTYARQTARCNNCETLFSPDHEIKALPRGIVSKTSDLLMQPLWGPRNKKNPKRSTNLLAMAVGIKQKESVNKIVQKFLSSNFVVMLFHYDGIVNDWREFEWSDRAIHVSATSQTKWWFAKRFLHPDIVSDYAYIFLWDEDLGVEHFNVDRYLSIIKEEGLQISQPALDLNKSTEVHHPLTARDSKQRVHRKVHTVIGRRKCDENSTEPPCTGWVEMMAPVFSTASWRCAWHLIQGDRTKNIGIVDSEYIIHYGLPTLGASDAKKAQAESQQSDARSEVRKLSFIELEIFKNRWKKAVKDDENWFDPYEKKQ